MVRLGWAGHGRAWLGEAWYGGGSQVRPPLVLQDLLPELVGLLQELGELSSGLRVA